MITAAEPAYPHHPGQLDGKTVLVTGAGRGLGEAIAVACAAAGARVIGTVRSDTAAQDVGERVRADGGSFESRLLDLRSTAAVNALAADMAAEFGGLDVLVNNSGIAGPTQDAASLSDEDWDEVIDVNLTGVFRCCRAFLPQMIERGSGSIITIGSISARTGLLNRSPYTASKAAISGLTRTLALEGGPHGVRVNMISPGGVDGVRIQEVIAGQATATGRSAEQVRAELTSRSALRRFVAPGEVAGAVVFLGSDAASGMTGADLLVTAGYGLD